MPVRPSTAGSETSKPIRPGRCRGPSYVLEQFQHGSRCEADTAGMVEPEQMASGTAADFEWPRSAIGFDRLVAHCGVAIRAGNHAAILDNKRTASAEGPAIGLGVNAREPPRAKSCDT